MNRRGFALVLALLIAISLSLVGLGAMAVAVRESAIAGAVVRRETARLRAEAGAFAALDDWSTRAHRNLDIGQTRTVRRDELTVAVSRIGAALFLVRAEWEEGSNPAPDAVGRVALLVRTFPPDRLTDPVPAAITVDGSGTVERGTVRVPASCDAPALIGPVALGADAVIDGPLVVVNPEDYDDPFPPGLLPALAAVQLGPGEVRPRPVASGGECILDPVNWGATGPGHPCHDLLPLVHATGPLTVRGGTGRGILVVDGDLVLDGGFHFQGILLVTGELTIRGGVTIEGGVRATSLRFEDGLVTRVPCDLDPLVAGTVLDRPFRPPSRWRVPAF